MKRQTEYTDTKGERRCGCCIALLGDTPEPCDACAMRDDDGKRCLNCYPEDDDR